jgi:hypothetical protein
LRQQVVNDRMLRLLQCIQDDDSNREHKMGLVYRLVRQSVKYVDVVTEHSYQVQVFGMQNSMGYSDLEDIDNRRSKTHDSLIALIAAVNRLCEHYGIAALYDGDDERKQKGDFALELVSAYFQTRV